MAIASVNPANGEVLKTFESLSDRELTAKLDLAATVFGLPPKY
jgi:succinate-semialdehyde dehydrogenase/glutarate-semialdehyde dehydrogenase